MKLLQRILFASVMLTLGVCAGVPASAEDDQPEPVESFRVDLGDEDDDSHVLLEREGDWLRMNFEIARPFENGAIRIFMIYIRDNAGPPKQFIWHAVTGDSRISPPRRLFEVRESGNAKLEFEPSAFYGTTDAAYADSWKATLWFDVEELFGDWGELEFAYTLMMPGMLRSFHAKEELVAPDDFAYKAFDVSRLAAGEDTSKRKSALQAQLLGEALIPSAGDLARGSKYDEALAVLKPGLSGFPGDLSFSLAQLDVMESRLRRDSRAARTSYVTALRNTLKLTPSWTAGHAQLVSELVYIGEPRKAFDYANDRQESLRIRIGGGSAHEFLRAKLVAAAACGEWEAIPELLDFEALVNEPIEVKQWNLKTAWINACFDTADIALAGGQLEVAQACLERVMELWHPEDVYNRLGRLRLRWAELLFDHSYATALIEYVESLDFEVDRARATDLVELYVKSLGLAFDPPDAIARIGAMLEEPVGQNNNETRQALVEYRDLLLEHADDWNDEVAWREEDAAKTNPVVTVEMDHGTFKIELFEDDAPNTVANFVTLVEDGFYDGLEFYRIETGWIVQGGSKDNDPATDGMGWAIKNEANHRQHWRGTIAMARTMEPDSADTTIFITIGNTKRTFELGTDWVVFGRITEGLSTAQRIRRDDVMKKLSVSNLRDHDYTPERTPVEED